MFTLKITNARKALFAALVLAGLLLALAGCNGEAGHGEEEPPNQVALERGPQTVPGGDRQRGVERLVEYGCGSCHTIPGIARADGRVGPPLNFWADRQYIAGSLPNTPDNLIYWIQFPQAVEPGTVMPNLGVSEDEARDMAAYLFGLTEERDLTHQLEDLGSAIGGLVSGEGGEGEGTGLPATGEDARLAEGERIYNDVCANCHQENGQGRGDYPPLAGSGLVTQEDPSGAIQMVLHGGSVMPAFADRFSDEEIAAVVSYIRSAWDNAAGPVDAGQVGELR